MSFPRRATLARPGRISSGASTARRSRCLLADGDGERSSGMTRQWTVGRGARPLPLWRRRRPRRAAVAVDAADALRPWSASRRPGLRGLERRFPARRRHDLVATSIRAPAPPSTCSTTPRGRCLPPMSTPASAAPRAARAAGCRGGAIAVCRRAGPLTSAAVAWPEWTADRPNRRQPRIRAGAPSPRSLPPRRRRRRLRQLPPALGRTGGDAVRTGARQGA